MTLFIACLLIFNFGMEWWWYGIAGAIWISRLLIIGAIRNFEQEQAASRFSRIADDSQWRSFGKFDKVCDAVHDAVRDVRYAVRDEVRDAVHDARICRAPPTGRITIKD